MRVTVPEEKGVFPSVNSEDLHFSGWIKQGLEDEIEEILLGRHRGRTSGVKDHRASCKIGW